MIEIVNAKARRHRASRPGSPPIMLSACQSGPQSPCLEALPPAALEPSSHANDARYLQQRQQLQAEQRDVAMDMDSPRPQLHERQGSMASSNASFATASHPFSPYSTTSTLFPSASLSPQKIKSKASFSGSVESPAAMELVTPYGSLKGELFSPIYQEGRITLRHSRSSSSMHNYSGVATPTEEVPSDGRQGDEQEEYEEYMDETADQACLGDLLFNPPWMLRKHLSQKDLKELKDAFGEAGFHGVVGYGVSMDLVETLLELMAVDVRHGEANTPQSLEDGNT